MIGQTSSTIGEEKRYNTRLTKSREEFVRIMKELKLSYPDQIGNITKNTYVKLIHLFLDKALPANMVCGILPEP